MVITNRCKLDLKLGFMVVRSEDTKRILLDEISVIIIENTGVAITGCLLNELSRRKVKVIFCDEKHNPASELVPLYGAHDSAAKVRAQIEWSKDIKDVVWTAIVSEKIRQQAIHLRVRGHLSEAEMLLGYLSEIEVGDDGISGSVLRLDFVLVVSDATSTSFPSIWQDVSVCWIVMVFC